MSESMRDSLYVDTSKPLQMFVTADVRSSLVLLLFIHSFTHPPRPSK